MATAEDGKLSEETARERLPPGFNSISELECPLCCESYSAQDTLRFPYQLHCRHVPGCATCLGALLVGSGAAKCIRCPVVRSLACAFRTCYPPLHVSQCRKNTSVQRVENLIVCEAIRSLLRAVASAATEERGATQTGFTVFVTPLQGGTIVFNEITSETTVEDFFQQVSDRFAHPLASQQ
jgi:hypothetical protein